MTLAQLKQEWDFGIGAEYGIVLEFPKPNTAWQGMTDENYDFARLQVEMMERELREYPVQMILGSKLETIHLVGVANFGGRAGGRNLFLGSTTSRRIFHHEMFHIFTTSYAPWLADSNPKVEWFNVKAFTYGTPQPDLTGFVSKYAQTHENEDKADTAAYIWVNGANVYERIKYDHVLRRKVVTVIKWYSSHGLTKFDYLTTTWWKLKR